MIWNTLLQYNDHHLAQMLMKSRHLVLTGKRKKNFIFSVASIIYKN